MNRRSSVFVSVFLAILLGGLGLAQPRLPVRPEPATVNLEVQRALDELLGQYQVYLRAQGHSGDLRCESAEAWSFPGGIEAAAKWAGLLVGQRGYTFTSEDQLKHSYAFTAISSLAGREHEIVFGGLIVHRQDTVVFMQRCQPKPDGPFGG